MNGGILYQSKYGSTLQYAEWLSKQLHLPILDIEKVSVESVTLRDFFIIGSPIYMGKLMIAGWLLKHQKMLRNKNLFLFIVCATPSTNTVKLAQISRESIPASLSGNTTVYFLPGRIAREKLTWLDRMVMKLAAQVEKDPELKKNMLEGCDHVDEKNLDELINDVRVFMSHQKSTLELMYALKL
jgi:menaquinone-dependent protoporphyrinogen IX oxidase